MYAYITRASVYILSSVHVMCSNLVLDKVYAYHGAWDIISDCTQRAHPVASAASRPRNRRTAHVLVHDDGLKLYR